MCNRRCGGDIASVEAANSSKPESRSNGFQKRRGGLDIEESGNHAMKRTTTAAVAAGTIDGVNGESRSSWIQFNRPIRITC